MYLIETLLIIPPISTFAAPAMFSSFCASFVSSLLVKVICKGVFSAQVLGEPEQEKAATFVVDMNWYLQFSKFLQSFGIYLKQLSSVIFWLVCRLLFDVFIG